MTTVETEDTKPAPVRRYKCYDSVLTDVGRRRNENQDAYGTAHTQRASLYIVADGMGGARGGATASAIAITVIAGEAITAEGSLTPASLKNAIERSNKAINARSRQDEELSGMGTTVVALGIVGDTGIIGHVGDSRIYSLRGSEFNQLTRDHTLVQELVETGAIPPEEAANHPIAHMLTRSLGPTESVEVDIAVLPQPLAPGDKFLLCSDGLYNLVMPEEIQALLGEKKPDDAVRELVDLALERGGTDNVTVQIVEVHDLDDAEIAVAYPDDGKVDIVVSRTVEISNIDTLIEEAERESAAEVGEADVQGNGSDPEAFSVEGIDADAVDATRIGSLGETKRMPVVPASFALQTPIEQRENQDKSGLRLGVVFVLLLVLSTAAYVALQYGALRRGGSSRTSEIFNQVVRRTEQQNLEREGLARELNEWADKKQRMRDAEGQGSAAQPADPGQPRTVSQSEGAQSEGAQSQAAVGKVDSGSVPAARATEQSIEEIKAKADDLSVPPAPDVQIYDEDVANEPADRPIIWENEQRRLSEARLDSEEQSPAEARPASTGARSSIPLLYSASELAEIAEQKSSIRDRIADLDVKLQMLALQTREQAEEEQRTLEKTLSQIEKAIDSSRKELEQDQEALADWITFKKEAVGRQRSQLAEKIAERDPELKSRFQEYRAVAAEYRKVVQDWQKNPTDLSAAQTMGALGRQQERERTRLEDAVSQAITTGIERVVGRVAQQKTTQANLETSRARINRHIGYLEGFTPLNAGRRKELRATYLRERKELVRKLDLLRRKLSDPQELELRRRSKTESITAR